MVQAVQCYAEPQSAGWCAWRAEQVGSWGLATLVITNYRGGSVISEEVAKEWFRQEIAMEGRRFNHPDSSKIMKDDANSSVHAYVRAAVHLELGGWDEWRAVAVEAMGDGPITQDLG